MSITAAQAVTLLENGWCGCRLFHRHSGGGGSIELTGVQSGTQFTLSHV